MKKALARGFRGSVGGGGAVRAAPDGLPICLPLLTRVPAYDRIRLQVLATFPSHFTATPPLLLSSRPGKKEGQWA